MVHMLEGLGTVPCMKQYFFIIFTLNKLSFEQVDPVLADDRRKVLNVLEDLILGRKVVDVSFVLSERGRWPKFTGDGCGNCGHVR